jgi:26S proteasome regulatory subunit N7
VANTPAQIIESPEVLQVIDEIPHLRTFTTSLYGCDYATFFVALAAVEQTHLLPSRVLSTHTRFYVRSMRVLAYQQLLASYSSVTLKAMASAFGVSEGFIDEELARFIAAGRISAAIDRVSGTVSACARACLLPLLLC